MELYGSREDTDLKSQEGASDLFLLARSKFKKQKNLMNRVFVNCKNYGRQKTASCEQKTSRYRYVWRVCDVMLRDPSHRNRAEAWLTGGEGTWGA